MNEQWTVPSPLFKRLLYAAAENTPFALEVTEHFGTFFLALLNTRILPEVLGQIFGTFW